MGVVFFLTLAPILLAILGVILVMTVTGIVVLVAGVGGSIVSATAIKDKQIKTVSLYFFISLLMLGVSCLAVLGGIIAEVSFFIIPTLIVIGIAVITLSIIGMIKALSAEGTAPKIIFTILLTVSAILGALVFAAGVLALILS